MVDDETLARVIQEEEVSSSESDTDNSSGEDTDDDKSSTKKSRDGDEDKDHNDDADGGDGQTGQSSMTTVMDYDEFMVFIQDMDKDGLKEQEGKLQAELRDIKQVAMAVINKQKQVQKALKKITAEEKKKQKMEDDKKNREEQKATKSMEVTLFIKPVGFEQHTTTFSINIALTDTVGEFLRVVSKMLKINKKKVVAVFNNNVLESMRKTLAGAGVKANNTVEIHIKGLGGGKRAKQVEDLTLDFLFNPTPLPSDPEIVKSALMVQSINVEKWVDTFDVEKAAQFVKVMDEGIKTGHLSTLLQPHLQFISEYKQLMDTSTH